MEKLSPGLKTVVPGQQQLLRALAWFVAIMAAVYLLFILSVDVGKLVHALRTFSWSLLPWLLLLPLSSYLLRFLRWQYFLVRLGYRLSAVNSMLLYFSGFALTTTPGKSGEVIRSLFLRQWGVPYRHSIGAFITERFLDLLVMLGLALLAAWQLAGHGIWITLSLLLLLFILLLLPTRGLRRLLMHLSPSRLRRNILRLHDVLGRLFHLASLPLPLVLGLLSWLAQGAAFYLVLDGLGLEMNLFLAIGIYATSILLGAVSFIAGGIGVTEGAMVLLLAGMGIDSTLAVLAALLSRAVTLWLAISLGIFSMFRLGMIHSRDNDALNTVVHAADSMDNTDKRQTDTDR